MERLFQILAVILIGIAAFFLWRGNWDGVFVSAVLGAVSFFLSIRFQVNERLKQREAKKLAEDQEQAALKAESFDTGQFNVGQIETEQFLTDKEKI